MPAPAGGYLESVWQLSWEQWLLWEPGWVSHPLSTFHLEFGCKSNLPGRSRLEESQQALRLPMLRNLPESDLPLQNLKYRMPNVIS